MYPQRLSMSDADDLCTRGVRAYRKQHDCLRPLTLPQLKQAGQAALRAQCKKRKLNFTPVIELARKNNGRCVAIVQFTPILSSICSAETEMAALVAALKEALPTAP